MKFVKNFFAFLFLIGILVFTIIYRTNITKFVVDNFIYKKEIIIPVSNQYKKNSSYLFVSETTDFIVDNKKEIDNVIYTFLNNGWDQFSFYCGDNYDNCIEEISAIMSDQIYMSYINNFANPYNSFSNLYVSVNNWGKITLYTDKVYTNEEIEIINAKIDAFETKYIKAEMSSSEKIKAFHDYVINNTKYDLDKATEINDQGIYTASDSQTAYGALIKGLAICGGYSDAMAIYLDRLGLKNYRIFSSNHVWNYVYLDNAWYHLDLTWDDPVNKNKEDILMHEYFLINTSDLETKDKETHTYPKDIYLEAS